MKLAQGFYTAATWPGVEPRIYDTLVRHSTSKPPSHHQYRAIMLIVFECQKEMAVSGNAERTAWRLNGLPDRFIR